MPVLGRRSGRATPPRKAGAGPPLLDFVRSRRQLRIPTVFDLAEFAIFRPIPARVGVVERRSPGRADNWDNFPSYGRRSVRK